jgi:hypothetical protein
MKAFTALTFAAALTASLGALRPYRTAPETSPCAYSRGNPIPAGSSWADQFRCYQSSGRHVTIVGGGAFDAGTVSGGICVVGVANDRVQVAPCSSLSGEAAMTLGYPAIAYVIDDPKADAVSIYLAALLRR